MDAAKFKQIRKKYESKVSDFLDDIDNSGFNGFVVKDALSKMSDKEFIELAKRMITQDDFNFSIDLKQLADNKHGNCDVSQLKDIAKKHNIKLTEYVFMPFRNPNGKPMCTLTQVPIIYCQVRRFFQQMLQHKNAISNNNSKTNPLTGQVINDDKTASTTNVQTYALAAVNETEALKEFLGPRSDDFVSKQQMLNMIETNGEVNLSDLTIDTHNKQAINTTEVFCKAAGVEVTFAGYDLGINIDVDDLNDDE